MPGSPGFARRAGRVIATPEPGHFSDHLTRGGIRINPPDPGQPAHKSGTSRPRADDVAATKALLSVRWSRFARPSRPISYLAHFISKSMREQRVPATPLHMIEDPDVKLCVTV